MPEISISVLVLSVRHSYPSLT